MKRRMLLLPVIGFLILASGCKKYLEHVADSTLANLDTPEKVSQLLGTAYPQANYMAFCEAMSDNVGDKGIGIQDRADLDPYFFNDVQDNQEDTPEGYWQACYHAIAVANQALEACRMAKDTTAYQSQKGEALIARAYAHFMLVNFFAKSYDSTTASTDPGVPYVTEPETVVNKQYDRTTVKNVYDHIESDLLQGLPLLNDNYTIPKYHFTHTAAYAFAARFYLYKRHYQQVTAYAELAFPQNTLGINLRPWNTTYQTMTPQMLELTYANSTENANLLLVETPSLYARSYPAYRYGLDYAHENEILLSGSVAGDTQWAFPLLIAGDNQNYFIPKINEYFVRSSVNATIGEPYVMQPLFTSEEVLFNRAEANVYLNNTDAVLADLNLYASKTIKNYDASAYAITATKVNNYYGDSNYRNNLLQAVMDFKRAAFLQEGMRWFDLMRYKIPITHYTNTGTAMVLTATDKRRILQIPSSASMSGVAPNPR